MKKDSEICKELFSNEDEKNKLKIDRYNKFEKCLDQLRFDNVMLRLVYEHDIANKYRYCKPKLNNKLDFIFNYLKDNFADIKYYKLENTEPNRIWSFRGYFFQIFDYDEPIFKVYNKDDLTLMITT